MQSKISIVIGREYKNKVQKKSFFVMTILVPILFLLFAIVPIVLGNVATKSINIALIDHTHLYKGLFTDTQDYHFVESRMSTEAWKELGKDNPDKVEAIVEIKADLLTYPEAIALYSYKQIPVGITEHINHKLSIYLSEKKLEQTQIPDINRIVEESRVTLSIPTYKWSQEGEETRSSGFIASFIGIILASVSFFFITTYGSLVMGSVLEEKKNRIMEVMVSSVKPFDMMMGKIIALGLVGITQILIWVILTGFLMTFFGSFFVGSITTLSSIASIDQSQITGFGATWSEESFLEMQAVIASLLSINLAEILVMFLFCFVGGYLLYASIFAAVGASVSAEEDSNQFIMPVMMLLMFAFYAAFGSMKNPDGPLALWSSFIPFTSPIVMMVRLPYEVPLWQQLLSLFILFLSSWGITWISAKIYRVGILMYGKKPSFKELYKWLRYR